MYAKLVFNNGTTNSEKVRDIARIVTSANGAGGATLGACEFVDVGNSTIDDTNPVNWSLGSGFSIDSGANVLADTEKVLTTTHPGGGTLGVRLACHFSGSLTNANNTQYGGLYLSGISDYGLATEQYIWADSSVTPSASYPTSSINGDEIHVVANERTLAIVGSRFGDHAGGKSYIVQIPEYTGDMVYLGRPGYVLSRISDFLFESNQGYSTGSISNYYGPFNSTSQLYDRNTIVHLFVDCFYDWISNKNVRFGVLAQGSDAVTSFSGPSSDSDSDMLHALIYDDDSFDAAVNASQILIGSESSWAGFSDMGVIFPNRNGTLKDRFSGRNPLDSSGNPSIVLLPVYYRQGLSGQPINTIESGLFAANSLAGSHLDVINDGADDYIVISFGSTTFYHPVYYALRLR